jgi:hypothetical protein
LYRRTDRRHVRSFTRFARDQWHQQLDVHGYGGYEHIDAEGDLHPEVHWPDEHSERDDFGDPHPALSTMKIPGTYCHRLSRLMA